MIILGITDGDDGGACIVQDGIIMAAINEERLNRSKMTIGFPSLSIEEVLRVSNIDPTNIDYVAMASFREEFHSTPVKNDGWFQSKTGIKKQIKNKIASTMAPFLGKYNLPKKTYHKIQVRINRKRKIQIPRLLRKIGIEAPIHYFNHHYCHALSAYHTSGFDSALTISLDGGGDGACSHVYKTNSSKIENLLVLDSFNSIGNFYAYVTHLCGYKAAIHEGKITGLAAHGEPVYKDMLLKMISYHDGQIVNSGNIYHQSAIAKIKNLLPVNFKHEDLAASIQEVLEEVVLKYVEYWIRETGSRNIALAGGVFANVKLNQRIHALSEIEQMFIHPGMGDGGLMVGAAYAMYRKLNKDVELHTPRLKNVYLGSEYSNAEIKKELDSDGFNYQYHENVEYQIAKLIADGKVVARFNGRMEYGPRSLGNRSILYHTGDPSVNDWLNRQLNRTEFMPFAPATLYEYRDKCYKNIKGAEYASFFMTVTFDCTDFMKKVSPAAIHIDDTARPQLVDEKSNPSFYNIIKEYYKLTGIPSIINTSFNMHEEPIVCTPNDALRAFRESRMDYLAIGKYIVKNSD
jgi:Predicted carbamoyl transferase, NodU family